MVVVRARTRESFEISSGKGEYQLPDLMHFALLRLIKGFDSETGCEQLYLFDVYR